MNGSPSSPHSMEPGRETLANVPLVRRIGCVRHEFESRVASLSYDQVWKDRIRNFGLALMSGSLRSLQTAVSEYVRRGDHEGLSFVAQVLDFVIPCEDISFEVGYVSSPVRPQRTVAVFCIVVPTFARLLAIGDDEYGVRTFSVFYDPVPTREPVADNVNKIYKQVLQVIEPADPGPPPICSL